MVLGFSFTQLLGLALLYFVLVFVVAFSISIILFGACFGAMFGFERGRFAAIRRNVSEMSFLKAGNKEADDTS